MSFAELFVVFIVASIVLSPKDIKQIILYFQKIQKEFYRIKDTFLKNLSNKSQDLVVESDIMLTEVQEINFYLNEISNLGSMYQGEYDLEKIKAHYKTLQNKIPQAKRVNKSKV
ncbi:MAG: DUF2672 domain-containing protein [Rickettsiaceae bacterium]|nr:DUF2672 domain-containing protein [Rickettsiaceae bacterium]